MQRTFPRVIALAFAVVLMATACSKSSPAAGGSSSSPPAAPASSGGGATGGGTIPIGNDTANDHGTTDVTGMTSVNVEQHNDSSYYFDPTVLSGTAAQNITVHLENKGSLPHTFTIDAQGISVELQPGEEKDVPVALPSSGVVEFYCMFHHGLGMAGELKVA